jgi:hypothetical protein
MSGAAIMAGGEGGFQDSQTAKARSGHRVQSLPVEGTDRQPFYPPSVPHRNLKCPSANMTTAERCAAVHFHRNNDSPSARISTTTSSSRMNMRVSLKSATIKP